MNPSEQCQTRFIRRTDCVHSHPALRYEPSSALPGGFLGPRSPTGHACEDPRRRPLKRDKIQAGLEAGGAPPPINGCTLSDRLLLFEVVEQPICFHAIACRPFALLVAPRYIPDPDPSNDKIQAGRHHPKMGVCERVNRFLFDRRMPFLLLVVSHRAPRSR